MVTMYPVMRNLGISPASACGVIATSQAFEIGPTQTNAIFSAGQSGMDPTSYFVDYQIWLVAPMLLVTMVLHFFWQRHCDRQEGWDPALHRGEHAGLDEKGADEVAAPTWYGLLPIIPFVLMMTFSKLLVTSISVSVEVAMLLSVFIGMLCELLRTRSVRTAFRGAVELPRRHGQGVRPRGGAHRLCRALRRIPQGHRRHRYPAALCQQCRHRQRPDDPGDGGAHHGGGGHHGLGQRSLLSFSSLAPARWQPSLACQR
jgi:hypothetical protein